MNAVTNEPSPVLSWRDVLEEMDRVQGVYSALPLGPCRYRRLNLGQHAFQRVADALKFFADRIHRHGARLFQKAERVLGVAGHQGEDGHRQPLGGGFAAGGFEQGARDGVEPLVQFPAGVGDVTAVGGERLDHGAVEGVVQISPLNSQPGDQARVGRTGQ